MTLLTTVQAQPDQSSLAALDALALAARPAGYGYTDGDRDAALAAFRRPRRRPQESLYAFGAGLGFGWRDGRTFVVECGPGLVQLRAEDRVRVERSTWRADRVARASRVQDLEDVLSDARTPLVGIPASGERRPSRVISEWSARSRSRMLRKFAAVDFADLDTSDAVLAMVTLTYPGAWEHLAPSGKAAKRHLANFRRRWRDDVGGRLDGAWKLEFQRRGAPHFHLLVPVPALVRGERFESWLSRTWADVVGATGEEYRRHLLAGTGVDFAKTGRYSDPRRCAVYFVKHGTKTLDDKEYQHLVPPLWQLPGMGPGRFWGFWGLRSRVAAVELDVEDFVTARRICRRAMRARSRRMAYGRRRAAALRAGLTSSAATRAGILAGYADPRSMGAGGSLAGGWLLVNSGPRFAADLARAVDLARSVRT